MQSPVEAANAIIDLYSLSLKRYSQGGTDYRSVVEFKHGFLWRFHHFIFDFRYLEASKRRSSDKMHFVRCPIPRRKKATSNGASFVGLDGLRVTLKVVSNLFLTQQISSWRGSGIGINEEGIDKKTQQAQELSLQAFATQLTKESILDSVSNDLIMIWLTSSNHNQIN